MSQCYVYIAAEGDRAECVKVGISSNPLARVRKHNTSYGGIEPLRLFYFVACKTRQGAYLIEQETIKRLRNAGHKNRQEVVWCRPALAVGYLQLVWQETHPDTFSRVQFDLFGEAA